MSRNSTIRSFRFSQQLRVCAEWLAVALLSAGLCGGARAQAGRPAPRMQRWSGPRQQAPKPQPPKPQPQKQNNPPRPEPNRSAPPSAPQLNRSVQPPASPAYSGQAYPQGVDAQQVSHPAPIVRATPAPSGQLITPNRPGQTQQHLGPWMQSHSNMSLADQHRALENEPGFRSLPPQEQQQLHNRLTQLNTMQPQQRDKVIERNESMEHLPPPQRQQLRNTMAELGSLSEDRQHAVAHAFHQALAMPEGQRQAWMNSPQFRSQFNENERGTINHLLTIQPAAAQAGFSWAKPQE